MLERGVPSYGAAGDRSSIPALLLGLLTLLGAHPVPGPPSSPHVYSMRYGAGARPTQRSPCPTGGTVENLEEGSSRRGCADWPKSPGSVSEGPCVLNPPAAGACETVASCAGPILAAIPAIHPHRLLQREDRSTASSTGRSSVGPHPQPFVAMNPDGTVDDRPNRYGLARIFVWPTDPAWTHIPSRPRRVACSRGKTGGAPWSFPRASSRRTRGLASSAGSRTGGRRPTVQGRRGKDGKPTLSALPRAGRAGRIEREPERRRPDLHPSGAARGENARTKLTCEWTVAAPRTGSLRHGTAPKVFDTFRGTFGPRCR
jgi:hypothetical protein